MSLFVNNDHSVSFEGEGRLVDQNGLEVEGATVELRLFHLETDEPPAGVTWPVVLVDKGGGEYEGQLPAEADIKQFEPYRVVFRAVAGGVQGEWESIMTPEPRGFGD